jgi:hypothetical protein
MKRYFIELYDSGLAYFAQGTAEFDACINDIPWARAARPRTTSTR